MSYQGTDLLSLSLVQKQTPTGHYFANVRVGMWLMTLVSKEE